MKQTDDFLPLSAVCAKYARRKAIMTTDGSCTYHEYHRRILQAAHGLRLSGIKKGDRIALVAENSVHLPLLMFALFTVGAIAVPVNHRIPLQSMRSMLTDINCRKILLAKKFERNLRLPSAMVIQIEKFFKDLAKTDIKDQVVKLPLHQAASIVFTSGSTGNPKAVLHTIGNHYYNALGSNQNIGLRPGDRWYLSLPLYHVGGLAILFRTLLAGVVMVIGEKNEDFVKTVTANKITHLSFVPTQLYRHMSHSADVRVLRRLKAILLGGGPAVESLLLKAVRYNLPVFLTYGLTEMASQVTTTRRKINKSGVHFFNCGKILRYRNLKINRQGEILVKGLTLFRGYVSKRRIHCPLDKDGWYHSGDLGKFDSRGNLRVMGRRDNMFISGGENIYPEEIENQLKNIADVQDAVVVPVANREFGLRPAAFVKLRSKSKVRLGFLHAYLEKKLPRYLIPDFFFSWPEEYSRLKPDRTRLRSLALKRIGY